MNALVLLVTTQNYRQKLHFYILKIEIVANVNDIS